MNDLEIVKEVSNNIYRYLMKILMDEEVIPKNKIVEVYEYIAPNIKKFNEIQDPVIYYSYALPLIKFMDYHFEAVNNPMLDGLILDLSEHVFDIVENDLTDEVRLELLQVTLRELEKTKIAYPFYIDMLGFLVTKAEEQEVVARINAMELVQL